MHIRKRKWRKKDEDFAVAWEHWKASLHTKNLRIE